MTLCDVKSVTLLKIDSPNLQFLNVRVGRWSFSLNDTPTLVGMKLTGFRGVRGEVDLLRSMLSTSTLQELEISVSFILLKCY